MMRDKMPERVGQGGERDRCPSGVGQGGKRQDGQSYFLKRSEWVPVRIKFRICNSLSSCFS